MKKVLLTLAIFTLLGGLVLPLAASAQTMSDSCAPRKDVDGLGGLSCPAAGVDCPYDSTTYDCTMCCLTATVMWVVDWLFFALTILVVIFILLGAFTLITSSGDEEKIRTGRNYIIWAMIGIAVAILAKALPYFIATMMGAS